MSLGFFNDVSPSFGNALARPKTSGNSDRQITVGIIQKYWEARLRNQALPLSTGALVHFGDTQYKSDSVLDRVVVAVTRYYRKALAVPLGADSNTSEESCTH